MKIKILQTLTLAMLIGIVWPASSQQLQKVSDPPLFSTYYSMQMNHPPVPFNPFPDLGLDVYSWTENGRTIYYYDDTEVDYVSLRAWQREQFESMSLFDGPPLPGEGGEGGGGSGEFPPAYNYGTNDLWLEIISMTNTVGTFVIHSPVTNGIYDLFITTNLAPDVPGLNLTNWMWLYRTFAGETNLTVTNLWMSESYFQLGTMLDTDSDGLTDAYENLVSHTNPNSWDTDGDGISDYYELLLGLNPNLNESALPAGRLNYTYNANGWLSSVSGARSEAIGSDAEGNISQVTP